MNNDDRYHQRDQAFDSFRHVIYPPEKKRANPG
jgi:hypothetical protein